MELRMSVRVPAGQSATVKPRLGRAFSGEVRDVSFNGAFVAAKTKQPQSLLGKPVRVRLSGPSAAGGASLEIPARVVRAGTRGLGVAFDEYNSAVTEYLERIYAEQLRRQSQPFSLGR